MFWNGLGTSRLGLEEGQVRLTCPPGTVKVYLQEFPWEKCVPAEQTTQPPPVPVTEEVPEFEAPPPVAPAPSPAPYKPPGKARFLDLDPATGQVIDPDTGEPIPVETAFALTPIETTAVAVAAVGIVAAVLFACGVFRK